MRASERLRGPGLTIAVGLLAATPVLLAAIRFFMHDWTPVGDNAVIAMRAYDVLTPDSPLLGQYSAASHALGYETHSLGPMLYWLLALPSRFGGAGALTVVVCLVNTAAVVGTVALARRRGGTVLMVLTAAALVVMSGSLVSKVYADVWNPAIAILPFTLLVFTAWSIACGDYKLLPLAVLLASFVIQAHLTFILPAVGLFGVAVIGLWAARREIEQGALRRWLLIALAVAAVCWSAPLLDQAIHRPGNLVQVVRSATVDTPKTGFSNWGRDTLVRTVGVPPWWLEIPEGQSDRFGELIEPPGTVRIVSGVVMVLALVALLVAGVLRSRRDVAAAAASSLVLLAGITAVASSTPTKDLSAITLGYSLWWASVAGMFAWLTLFWGAAQLIGRPRLTGRARTGAIAALAVAGTVAGVVTLVRAGQGEDVIRRTYEPMREIAARLEQLVPPGDTVLVGAVSANSGFDTQFDYEMGTIYTLRRHGAEPVARDARLLGSRYDAQGKEIDYTLLVGLEGRSPGRGARQVARAPVEGGPAVIVWRLPAP